MNLDSSTIIVRIHCGCGWLGCKSDTYPDVFLPSTLQVFDSLFPLTIFFFCVTFILTVLDEAFFHFSYAYSLINGIISHERYNDKDIAPFLKELPV